MVVMGVSGCGKSTLGKRLAELTGQPFFDADDFHPKSNVEKMRNGIPLDDKDREPWLRTLRELIQDHQDRGGLVLACSALKERYRQILSGGTELITWIYLKGSKEAIRSRLEARTGHFMPASLVDSQFATLEEPTYGLVFDIAEPVESVARQVLAKLKQGSCL
ncbi:MAG: gluconokinase [Candidatus Methylacidiphilales bacterium]